MASTERLNCADWLEGACDCAIHVYDATLPIVPTADFMPPDAPLSAYPLGRHAPWFKRIIISQPTAYGADNTLLLDGLAQLGGRGRGVAVIPPDCRSQVLMQLHDAGVRGVRFMLQGGGSLTADMMPVMAERIASLGWHIKLQADCATLDRLIAEVSGTVLVDVHPGTVATKVAREKVLSAFRDQRIWLALSAPHAGQIELAAGFNAFVVDLLELDPTRIVWASNWPHVKSIPPIDPLEPVRWLAERIEKNSHRVLREVLVNAPARLYGFR